MSVLPIKLRMLIDHFCPVLCIYFSIHSLDKTMFGLFKSDPNKKLRKQYDQKLEQAMHAQRKGDIRTYSVLTAEAEALWEKIEQNNK